MNNPKFDDGTPVKVKNEEGVVMETNPTSKGGFQCRVRIDTVDSWHPEEDLKLVGKPPAPPTAAKK
jgi:hypothetical protein